MGPDITRHNLGWTLLFFVLLLSFFWGRAVVSSVPEGVSAACGMPLGEVLSRFSQWLPAAVRDGVLLLLILCNGLLVTRTVIRNMILIEKTYMPSLIYLTVGCGSYFSGMQLPVFVVSFLMIRSFDLMILSFRRTVRYGTVFDSALLTGISVLIYAPAAVYALLLPVALVIFKKGWREWIVALTGLLLPFAICSYVLWGTGERFGALGAGLWECLKEKASVAGTFVDPADPFLLVFWAVVVLLTGWALVLFALNAKRLRTRPYKAYLYFVWILFFSVLPLAVPGRGVADFPLIAVPLAVIVPTCFNRRGGWIQNTAYLLLFTSVLFYNLLHLFHG